MLDLAKQLSPRIGALLLGLLLGAFLASVGFSFILRHEKADGLNAARTLSLAHSLDVSHPVHKALEFMAKRTAELSTDSLQLQIFPNSQLGSETETIEMLQRGALDISKTSSAILESFVPETAIFGVPFLFRDGEHMWNTLNGPTGKKLLDLGTSRGFRGLCYYDAGARCFYTTKAVVRTPEDLVGLKIRVQKSRSAMELVAALGASPTPIAWGELYSALQQGAVDGAENNLPSYFTNRHFEVCKQVSLDRHSMVPDVLLIGSQTWSTLSATQQSWLQQAADESSELQRKLWQAETERVRKAAEAEGVIFTSPDRQTFVDAMEPVYRRLVGTPLGQLVETIQALE